LKSEPGPLATRLVREMPGWQAMLERLLPTGASAAVELEREEEIGELGVLIGLPGGVFAFGLEIVEIDGCRCGGRGRRR